jgi:hypothetical protein
MWVEIDDGWDVEEDDASHFILHFMAILRFVFFC